MSPRTVIRTSLALFLALYLAFPVALAQTQDAETPFDKNGSLRAIRRFSPDSDDESAVLEVTIPRAALGTSERKLKARTCLFKEAQVLQCSKDFEVSFPKN